MKFPAIPHEECSFRANHESKWMHMSDRAFEVVNNRIGGDPEQLSEYVSMDGRCFRDHRTMERWEKIRALKLSGKYKQ